jgi:hypothetical protein
MMEPRGFQGERNKECKELGHAQGRIYARELLKVKKLRNDGRKLQIVNKKVKDKNLKIEEETDKMTRIAFCVQR